MYLTIAKWVGGLLLGLMVAWIVYAGLIRPTTKPPVSSSQKADNIINYTYSPRLSFGCMRFDVPKKEVMNEQKEDITTNANSVNTGSNPL
jgi:hypothetical protein